MAAAPAIKRGGGGLVTLPEAVLLDLLSRLRIKDLFRLAVTSRWWMRLFTDDPAFLRGLSPAQGHGARLLGFFFQQTSFVRCERMTKDHRMQTASAFTPTFVPMPWSTLVGPTDRALTSFMADDDGALFNYAEPLASRNGIVLLRLVPRASSVNALSKSGLLFALCNPVTGERHVAPPMTCACLDLKAVPQSYAIVTASDVDGDEQQRRSSSRRHVFSQLLIVTSGYYMKDIHHAHLHSYSAATRSWSTPVTCPHMDWLLAVASARSAVLHRGAAHWLYEDYDSSEPTGLHILSSKVGSTSHVSLTKLSAITTAGQTWFLFAGGDGRLSIVGVHGMYMAVWTQQQQPGEGGDSASWLRARLIPIPMEVPSPHPYAMVQRHEWFEFNGGAMLVLFDGGAVFTLDIENKVVEKLTMELPSRLFGTHREMIVPYEMDLSEFFAFQLGRLFAREKASHTFDLMQ